jgi:acyl-CoA reductase-like NAD-dependent aldehyde dehydrogenase
MMSTTSRVSTRFPEFDPERSYNMIIGGRSVPSVSGRTFRCLDPYDNVEWGHVARGSAEDVDAAVTAARAAFPGWAATPAITRLNYFRKWSDLLQQHVSELARLQVHENGKTIGEMTAAAGALSRLLDFVGQLALTLHGTTVQPFMPGHSAMTVRQPIGVVAAIAPWNNPLGLLSWKLMPALAAGNTVVVKPSEVTPVSTLRIVELALEAGFPDGVINVVTGDGEAGAALAEHPDIDKIGFTGSTATGRRIAESAGRRLIGTTLELGGKGPQIVFPDADLDRAVHSLAAGITAGTGQACNAGSRLLVHESIREQVVEQLTEVLAGVTYGDPLDPASQIGPLASRAQYERVTGYLAAADDEPGTSLLCGSRSGSALPGAGDGLFVEPTLFHTPDPQSRLRREEIFGPVGALIGFETEEEAVGIANESEFGLVSGLWTRDVERARRVAHRLQSGVVWINTWRAFSTNVPFGGWKSSGVGHELGLDLLDAYTEVKAIWLGPDGG